LLNNSPQMIRTKNLNTKNNNALLYIFPILLLELYRRALLFLVFKFLVLII